MEQVPNILLIDDEEKILRVLARQLRDEPVSILTAQSGAEALKIISSEKIAVIVCDQQIPDMSGAEILSAAREIQPEAQRITLTGHYNLDSAMDAINRGGVFRFLLKPWSAETLKKTVREALEIFRINAENRQLQELTKRQNTELESLNQRLVSSAREHEQLLRASWKLQESILIDSVPDGLNLLDICCCTIPALDLNGDFIFFHKYSPSLVDFAFGDVMGKGLSAALVGAAMRGYFMRECGRAEALQPHNHGPGEIIRAISGEVSAWLMKTNQFVSMLYARIDSAKGTISFVDCGSTKPLLLKNGSSEPVTLEGDNCPLGIAEAGDSYAENTASLNRGDLVFCYSDGILEAEGEETCEQFGQERLKKFLLANSGKDSMQVVKKLIRELRNHTGTFDMCDDFTCISIKFDTPVITSHEREKDTPASYLVNTELNSNYNDLDKLHKLLASVVAKCPELKDMPERRDMITLAVHEAFTNIIRHAYLKKKDMPVWLDIHQHANCMDVVMCDYGRHFSPEKVVLPDFSGQASGGFGFYIINTVADEVCYDIDRKARNRLAMSFSLVQKGDKNGCTN